MEKLTGKLPTRRAVLAVLALSISPAEGDAQSSQPQRLISETGTAISRACQLLPRQAEMTYLPNEIVAEFYRTFRTENMSLISSRAVSDPEAANARMEQLLQIMGYDQFDDPITTFQTNLHQIDKDIKVDGIVGEQTLNLAEQINQVYTMCVMLNSQLYLATTAISNRDRRVANLTFTLSNLEAGLLSLTNLLDREGNTDSDDHIAERIFSLGNQLRAARSEIQDLQDQIDEYEQGAVISQLRQQIERLITMVESLRHENQAPPESEDESEERPDLILRTSLTTSL